MRDQSQRRLLLLRTFCEGRRIGSRPTAARVVVGIIAVR